MYRIAVMGDRDSIYGFSAIGLDVYPVADAGQAGKLLKRLADNGYAVIYITEWLFERLAKEIENYRERQLPALIPIPGVSGNTGLGLARVKKSVEQAVGSDIIFGEQ